MSIPVPPSPLTPPETANNLSCSLETPLPNPCFQKALEDLKAMAQTPGRRELLLFQMHSYVHAYEGSEPSTSGLQTSRDL